MTFAHPAGGDPGDKQEVPAAPHFAIRVRGALSETLLCAFPELTAEPLGRDTVLGGSLPDQAALHGVLSQIEALGLELLEVRRHGAEHR